MEGMEVVKNMNEWRRERLREKKSRAKRDMWGK
jgi:hypothetical protein